MTGNSAGDGGGLLLAGATADISDATLATNAADAGGGGIYVDNAELTLGLSLIHI